MDADVERLLERDRVISRRQHPELARRLHRLAATGAIRTVLPGIFAAADTAHLLEIRARAACRYHPRAVIVDEAAAALTFWKDLPVDTIQVAGVHSRLRVAGFAFTERTVPPALTRSRPGLRLADPAITALDLVLAHGGAAIDQLLRTRRATLAELRRALALSPGRSGNLARAAALAASRDNPWSELERRLHALLRAAGITGWSGNVRIGRGWRSYIPDVVFHDIPLIIELDGRGFHGADRFDDDRERGNDLLLAGYRVLRFTWHHVTQRPEWVVRQVRAAMELCRAA